MYKQTFKPNRSLAFIVLLLVVSIAATACGGSAASDVITDVTWQWTELVETEPASQSLVPTPENYTLTLGSDGELTITADCNFVGGSYTLDGDALSILLGPSTMAFCGEQSLDAQYLDLLSRVESYAVEGGELILSLRDGAGTMTFIQG